MNVEKFLKDYFNENVEYTYSGLGLSNLNYYVKHNNENYMLRISNPLTLDMKNRTSEAQALNQTKNCSFALNPVYYSEADGILMTKFIPNAHTYRQCPLEDKVDRVANILKELHSLNVQIDETFNPISKYESFASKVSHPLFDTSEYLFILDELPTPSRYTLCHNDVVDGNLLFDKEHLFLIDFEYAANNDPLFDIISFFSENQIMDNKIRERFYKQYFGSLEIPYQQLNQWENYQNLLWCTWAMMMWELHHEEVYKEIATWKYNYLSK